MFPYDFSFVKKYFSLSNLYIVQKLHQSYSQHHMSLYTNNFLLCFDTLSLIRKQMVFCTRQYLGKKSNKVYQFEIFFILAYQCNDLIWRLFRILLDICKWDLFLYSHTLDRSDKSVECNRRLDIETEIYSNYSKNCMYLKFLHEGARLQQSINIPLQSLLKS